MRIPIIRAVFFLAIIISYFITAGVVKAAGETPIYGGVPVYGGGVMVPRAGEVLVDKTVQNPATGFFVDHLGLLDPKYRSKQIIIFHILVKNSGEQTLGSVTVKDILPQYVDFMSGPGTYNPNTRTLEFTVANLVGGTSQQFEVKGRISHPAMLPPENVICPTKGNPQPVNVVEAKADSQTDRDESQFCIEKEMIVPTVPPAGPQHWLVSFAGLGTLLIAGLYLRKKAYQK